jgi:hypothetical protein
VCIVTVCIIYVLFLILEDNNAVYYFVARVQRGSVGSALACCKAGPSRFSARHPMEVPSTEPTAVKIWRWASANV